MTDSSNRPGPDEIEKDVRRTQDDIGRTVDQLGEKLNPREVTRSVLGDEGTDIAEEALDVTRTNPIPVALIAIGVIWLIATSKSGPMKRFADRVAGKNEDGRKDLRPRSAEPAPIGPPGPRGEHLDRRQESDLR